MRKTEQKREKPMAKSTELSTVNEYKLMRMDPETVRELVQENLGGTFGPFDLPTITVPTGGNLYWTLPGDETPVKEVRGIVVYQQMARAYYKHGLDEGGDRGPPDCHSWDMEQGIGDPGIACAVCPNAQFGTARGGSGAGQACKQYRLLIMIRPESLLPIMLRVPPTSLGNFASYLMGLTDAGLLYNRVVTSLALEKTVKSGFETAVIKASKVGELGDAELERVTPIKEQFKAMFAVPRPAAA